MLHRNTAFMFVVLARAATRFESSRMSRQLTFSATVCALTMALFALTAGLGPSGGGSDAAVVAPLATAVVSG